MWLILGKVMSTKWSLHTAFGYFMQHKPPNELSNVRAEGQNHNIRAIIAS